MKRLILSILFFSSAVLLSSCACNGGSDSSMDFNTYSVASTNCGGGCSGCCGTGGW